MNIEDAKPIVIIGGPRCGTTSLYNWLSQAYNVCGSVPKESRFFETEYHKGPNFFFNTYFPNYWPSQDEFILTARPQLSWVGFCAERVKNVLPNAKIIMIVRNPIERAYSGWKLIHDMRPGREPDSFGQVISRNIKNYDIGKFNREGEYIRNLDAKGGCYIDNILEAGSYYSNVERYYNLFEDVQVLDFEEMIKNKEDTVRSILGEFDTSSINFREFLLEEDWFMPSRTKKLSLEEIKGEYANTYSKLKEFYRVEMENISRITKVPNIGNWHE